MATTYGVYLLGGVCYAGGLSREAADRTAARARAEVGGHVSVIVERADTCRSCGRATDEVGRLCVACEHAEDDARDAERGAR